jgi:uncharacterized protein (DUF3084 family)
MENQYPLTAAAAQIENFEALNEGIWITPQALQNIESALAASNTLAVQLATAEANLTANIESGSAALEARNQTIADRDVQITALNARIAELEGESATLTQTTADQDNTGAGEVPYHESSANPFNQFIDNIPGIKKV